MSTVDALLLAAGSGRRMGAYTSGQNKVLLPVMGLPVLSYSLRTFLNSGVIRNLLVVCRSQDRDDVQRVLEHLKATHLQVVEGGEERFDSVYNGLIHLASDPPEIILVHDTARPFVTQSMILESIEKAAQCGAATVAFPLSDTVKRGRNGFLHETLPREELYRIQTPQSFQFPLIWKAHQERHRGKANPSESVKETPLITDDCMLLEKEGHPIALVLGAETNIKITTPVDFALADWIVRNQL
jgi:2-C-methyl-D-erythritol 4-phosphate cytidylyltransferase